MRRLPYPLKIIELSCLFNELNALIIIKGEVKVKVWNKQKVVLWGYEK